MKITTWIWRHFEECLGSLCLFVIVILVFLNVILRYIFNHPLGWASETATILFVWMVMFGVGAAARSRLHPAVDFLTKFLPRKIGFFLSIAANVFALWLLADFTIRGWSFAWELGQQKFTGMMELPYTVVYLALPVGFGLMLLRSLFHFLSGFRSLGAEKTGSTSKHVGGL